MVETSAEDWKTNSLEASSRPGADVDSNFELSRDVAWDIIQGQEAPLR